jgi:HAD superfamily hydrolase (TIGR01509 family)
VEAIIGEAKQRGFKLAVASSSSREWVVGHLVQRGLNAHFDCVVCGDEVVQTKPFPDVYNTALKKLGLPADQVIAFEDSPNGVQAARSAGIFCVAIPNPLTRQLSFEQANLQLLSLADVSLDTLLSYCSSQR